MARVRAMTFGDQVGHRTRKYTGIVEERTQPKGVTTCTDFTGLGQDHTLTIVSRNATYPLISGDQGSVLSGYVYNAYPSTNSGLATSHLTNVTLEPNDVFCATETVARTNPAKPAVSVPLLLFESIRELPRMLYDSGVGVISGLAKDQQHAKRKKPSGDSSVSFNFGWDSLYRDVAALFDFTEHVEKKVAQLNALNRRGLRQSRTVWTETLKYVSTPNIVLQSQGGLVHGQQFTETTYKKWVSTRWKPANVPKSDPSAQETIQLARELVHGWHLAPVDIWNALPWSWLIDYFSNVGDYLAATRNSNEFALDSCCIMVKIETKSLVKIVAYSSGLSVTPGTAVNSDKRRRLGSIGITASVPFLGAGKLLNLLSIANNLNGFRF